MVRNSGGPVPMNIDPPAGLRQAKDYLKYGQKMKERGRLQTRIGDLKKELLALKGLYDSIKARFEDCAYERRRLLDKLIAMDTSSRQSTPYMSAASSLSNNKNLPVAKKAPPKAPPPPPPPPPPMMTSKTPSLSPRNQMLAELKERLKKRGGALYA